MLTVDFTFLFTAINLFILYLAVRLLFFKRLGGLMEKRSADIAADIENGWALKEEGETYRLKYEQLLIASAEQGRRILAEARSKAEKEYDGIIAGAKEEAGRIVSEARQEAERQREQVCRQISEEIVELSIMAASKIIEANVDSEKNRDIVKRFLDKGDVV